MVYDRVFVLAAEMYRRDGRYYDFLVEDNNGFLHGEVRVRAIEILWRQEKVKEIVVVGGPTRGGENKAQFIAKLIAGKIGKKIGTTVVPLESKASTCGNLEAIKSYYTVGENDGLLTQFYHMPRVLRLMKEMGINLIPICAEAILLTHSLSWLEKMREWYSSPAMVQRIIMEINGLSAIEETSAEKE